MTYYKAERSLCLQRSMQSKLFFKILIGGYFTILWWVLPYIHMNQPWVYMCSPSWTSLPPPSPSHPSGSSWCTSPEHPDSYIGPGLWEKARVGWFERIALKHVYYHMWNRLPVQVWCMRQGTQGWCTGMTLRDGMGREEGEGFRMGNTCTPMADSCECMAKTTTIL